MTRQSIRRFGWTPSPSGKRTAGSPTSAGDTMRAMQIIGHGVDIVEVARISRMVAEHGDRFLERCFTDTERQYAACTIGRMAERLAVRFACKEAVFKALGTGWRNGIGWTDVGVVHDPMGQPRLVLAGECLAVARRAGIDGWLVSLSHTETHAIASVIACGTSELAAESAASAG